MGGFANNISVLLVCDDVAYGSLLRTNITYKELAQYVRKKFSINHQFDTSLSYQMGPDVVRIDDDNDVQFFCHSVSHLQHTSSNKIFVKKVKLSSSNVLDLDLNVEYASESEVKDVGKKVFNKKNNENNFFKWKTEKTLFIAEPPDQPTIPVKKKKYEVQNNGKIVMPLKKGDDFENKQHCMYVIGKKALDEGFEYKPRKTTSLRYDVICKHEGCKWKIISSIGEFGNGWVLGTVNDIHTCSRTQINPNHRNATKKLLGWLLAPRLKDHSRVYKPKDIIHDINHEFNIDITYKKAWSGKNKALEINSGCPIESFTQLPYFFHNLKLANEGTVTHIETDDEGRFKMCFVAFGVAIRSFLAHMRPLIITDGAHLKGTYKGTNLVLVGMDGNNQIVPIAIGVSQGETGESWSWFLSKFKECIGEIPYMSIITDRHPSIIQACRSEFPNAFHGYCCRHLLMNCKMTSDKLQGYYWKAVKAYTEEEFLMRMEKIRGFRPAAYQKLQEAGFGKWSRAMCPSNRYNYMTSNYAESINSLTRHVRSTPITKLLDWYRATIQKWFCERREKYRDSNVHALSDWATRKVMERMRKSANWKVLGIEKNVAYQVNDNRIIHQVNLLNRTCTCRKWQLSGIPCGHVIAVCRSRGCTDCSDLALSWFRKTTLYNTYHELVYPVGEPCSWQCPEGLQVVKPPNMNFRKPGRPRKTDRIKSLGEAPIQVKCSRCGVSGHTRAACHEPIGNNQDSCMKRSRQTWDHANIQINNFWGTSQPNEAAYNNNIQPYNAAYNINFNHTQQYEPAYNNNIQGTHEIGAAYNFNVQGTQDRGAAYNNNFQGTQQGGAAYNNNFQGTQQGGAAYNNNVARTQEYEQTYTANYVGSQEYEVMYNNNYQSSQGYGTTFNSMGDFNLGQSSQQSYSTWNSTWNSTWDYVNLGDP